MSSRCKEIWEQAPEKGKGLAVTALFCKLYPERMNKGSGRWMGTLRAQVLLSHSFYRKLKEVCANQNGGSPVRVKVDAWQKGRA